MRYKVRIMRNKVGIALTVTFCDTVCNGEIVILKCNVKFRYKVIITREKV